MPTITQEGSKFISINIMRISTIQSGFSHYLWSVRVCSWTLEICIFSIPPDAQLWKYFWRFSRSNKCMPALKTIFEIFPDQTSACLLRSLASAVSSPKTTTTRHHLLTPLHLNVGMHILHTVLNSFPEGTDQENLLNNQEPLRLSIIFSILVTFDSGLLFLVTVRGQKLTILCLRLMVHRA